MTFGTTFSAVLIGRRVLKLPPEQLAGVVSGMQTQPAALAFAVERAKTEIPNVSYASVYPLATIVKIVCAQLLVAVLR
jgi:putative transport protein